MKKLHVLVVAFLYNVSILTPSHHSPKTIDITKTPPPTYEEFQRQQSMPSYQDFQKTYQGLPPYSEIISKQCQRIDATQSSPSQDAQKRASWTVVAIDSPEKITRHNTPYKSATNNRPYDSSYLQKEISHLEEHLRYLKRQLQH